eukprot:TRINITY_DN6542_c0_g1_i5.p1 TRINITY_DN6542_c0_g1~~TRINITY_DN6542_c0_g1_i5.p1  ORF type:complete len:111 (+),score=49.49 TRINITY_DN6542_c0_g1_i5:103-435(+)
MLSFSIFFFFFLMIRRPPRSTLSSSSAASDVYKRQVLEVAGVTDNELSLAGLTLVLDAIELSVDEVDLIDSGAEHVGTTVDLSLIHISEPTRLLSISYAVFCLKKKKKKH